MDNNCKVDLSFQNFLECLVMRTCIHELSNVILERSILLMLLKRDSLKYIFIDMQVEHGQRHLFKQYSLKTRRFIGNTSMDPQLSFLMANQGQVHQYILRHKTTAFFDGLNCPQQDLVVILT